MDVRAMRPEERELVLDLLECAFGERRLFARYMDNDPLFDADDILLAVDGDRPVSCVQIFEKRIWLAGEEISLGGIGSVATHPRYRGRGLATRLLADSDERMLGRGMPLALLFAARTRFYARRGWIQVPMDLIVLRREETWTSPDTSLCMRAFLPADLDVVQAMYVQQNAGRPGSTVRTEAYWRGQLRYAGTPDERFLLAERDGTAVAYARSIEFAGQHVMEHANLPNEIGALAALILSLCPPKRRLFLRRPAADLERELRESGATVERLRDPTPMWRVLDRHRLGALAGRDGDDTLLITELIRKPRLHYWLSDRF